MKVTLRWIAGTAVVLGGFTGFAAAQRPMTQTCAMPGNPEYLCKWSGPAGMQNRTCSLDVDLVDPSQKNPCDYGQTSAPAMSGHAPMCFAVANTEHIVFSSSHRRLFRVHRLVTITQGCPKDPFKHPFDPNGPFGPSSDSQQPVASAINCQYKMELQYQDADASGKSPPDPGDGIKHECHDPHLQIVKNPSP